MSEARCSQVVALLVGEGDWLAAVEEGLGERFLREPGEGPSAARWRGPLFNSGGAETVQAETGEGDVVIDLVPRQWPREIDADETAFWGPYSYSHGLARAALFNVIWEDAAQAVDDHRGVILLRLLERPSQGDLVPGERLVRSRRLAELGVQLAGLLAGALGESPAESSKGAEGLPGAAYFCPSGEVLLPVPLVAEMLQVSQTAGFPPLDLFANLRLAWLDDRWALFDTVGNRALGVRDIEIFCDTQRHDLNQAAQCLRQWSVQLMDGGSPSSEGHALSGPGGEHFTLFWVDDNLEPPLRPVVRMIPPDWSTMPAGLPERLGLRRGE